MRTLIVFLLFSCSVLAGPCPKNLPRIVGMDYHHARAKLIVAGFMPSIPEHTADIYELTGTQKTLGYLEGEGGCATGSCIDAYHWPGFTVHTLGGYSIVRKVTCP